MARVVKDPDVRRNEIIDVAQQLFLSKGYDDTSVQDVLDGVEIAKGTFYHYFTSKMALLDALISRMIEGMLETVEPIVDDEQMTALEKMNAYLKTILAIKTSNREIFMDFVRVIYRDENAIYRQKMVTASLALAIPFFTTIINQGIQEGVFNMTYPKESAEIVYAVLRSLSESMTFMLLDSEFEGDMALAFERTIAAHEDAISRILGYEGTLELIEPDIAMQWIELAASA